MTRLPAGTSPLRRKLLLAVTAVLLCAALALCYFVGLRHDRAKAPAAPQVPLSEEVFHESFPLLDLTRADQETDVTGAVDVDLSACGGECLIQEGGVYRLTGELKGLIRIAAEEQTVRLVLDSVTVTSLQGPALLVESAGKVILTLPEGSRSTISDSGHYPNPAQEEAAVFSSADLTINGAGALTVNGLYKDAVRSKNVVRIAGGEITIKCKRSGIHGTDGIYVAAGSLDISSQKNGLRTTKSGAHGRGNLVVAGGEHRIIAGRHAFLVGRGDLYVYNCVIHDKSIVSTENVGGKTYIQSGCIQ